MKFTDLVCGHKFWWDHVPPNNLTWCDRCRDYRLPENVQPRDNTFKGTTPPLPRVGRKRGAELHAQADAFFAMGLTAQEAQLALGGTIALPTLYSWLRQFKKDAPVEHHAE